MKTNVSRDAALSHSEAWHLLLAAESDEQRQQIQQYLTGRPSGRHYQFTHAVSGEEVLRLHRAGRPLHGLLLASPLPDMLAIEVLDQIRTSDGMVACPTLILWNESSPESVASLLRHGAQEVLPQRLFSSELLYHALETALERWYLEKEQRQQLRAAENRLSDIGKNLPDTAIYRYLQEADGRKRFLYLSAGIERLCGVKPEDVLRDPSLLKDQILPEFRPLLLEMEEVSARTLADFCMELPMRHPRGDVRWMRLRSRPHREHDGCIVWDGVQTDITSERELDRIRTQCHLLLKESRDFHLFFQSNGTLLEVNAAAERAYGYSREELLSKSLFELVAPEARALVRQQLETRIQGSITVESQHLRRDGTIFPVEVTWTSQEVDDESITLAVVRETTERQEAMQQLQASKERLAERNALLRLALEASHSMAFEWDIPQDQVRRLVSSNAALPATVAGFESLDQVVEKIYPPDQAHFLQNLHAAMRSDDGAYRSEFRVMLPDGSLRWLGDSGRVEFDDFRAPQRLVGISTDITPRKEAEERLLASESFSRHLADVAPSILYIYDLLEDRNVWGNREMSATLGFSVEQIESMAGRLIESLMHPDDWTRYLDHRHRIMQLADGQIAEFTYRFRRADGGWVWVSSRDMVFRRNEEGQPTQIIGAALDITQRKEAEERLRASEHRYRFLVENTNDLIYHYHLQQPIALDLPAEEQLRRIFTESYVTNVNHHFAHFHGFSSAAEMIGLPIHQIIEPTADSASVYQALVTHGHRLIDVLVEDRDPAGQRRIMSHSLVGEIEAGAIVAYHGSARDITDRILAQERLRRHEKELQDRNAHLTLAMQAGAAIAFEWDIVQDRVRRLLSSETSLPETGEQPQTLADILARVHPDDRTRFQANLEQALQSQDGRYRSEYRVVRPDGEIRWLSESGCVEFGAHGRPLRLLGITHDITDQQRLADQLRLQDRAISASPAGILIVDAHAHDLPILYASAGFERLCGYTAEEVVGQNCRFLQGADTDPDQVTAIRQALQDGQPIRLTVRNYRKDGTPFWNDLAISPVRDESNRLTHFVGVQNDVTELIETQAALRASQQRLQLGVQVAQLALADVDYQTGLNHLSAEAARLFGLGDREIAVPREVVHATFHPEDREELAGRIAASLDPDGPGWFDFDHRVVWPTGETRWLRVRKQVFFEGEGDTRRPRRAMLAAMDVTDEKVAAESVQASEAFVREVLNSLPEHIVVLDELGFVQAVNESWERYAWQNGGSSLAMGIGANYLEVCRQSAQAGDAMSLTALEGLQAVLAGHRDSFVLEYPCHVPDREQWFLMHAQRFQRGSRVVLSHIDITHRILAEQALRDSEAFYRQTLESIPGMVFSTRPDGYCDYVSEQWVAFTGVPAESQLGDGWVQVLHPDDRQRAREAWQRAVAGQGTYDIEYRVRTHSEQYEWFKARGRALRDQHGQIVRWLGVASNIHDLKQLQADLLARERELQTLADNTPDILTRFDRELHHVFVNAAVEQATGRPRHEFLGRTNRDLKMPADLCDVWDAVLRSVFQSEQPKSLEFVYHNSQGMRYFEAQFVPERDQNGDVCWVLGVTRDVTKHRLAELALRDSEERLRFAAEASGIGFWSWDLATGKSQRDARCASLFDLDVEDSSDEWMQRIEIADRDKVTAAIEEAIAGRQPYRAEFRVRHRDGTLHWLAGLGDVIRDAEGRAIRMLGANLDVTERRRAVELLQQQDKHKDEFLAMLAHELRNPLAPLRTGLEILRMLGDAEGRLTEVREMMARQVEHLVRLVNDLLDLSRVGRGTIHLQKMQLSVQSVVQQAVETCRPTVIAKQHRLTVDMSSESLIVAGDVTRLVQAVVNLLTNAAKYSEPQSSIQVTVTRENDQALIRVTDTGVGIAPDVLPTLWDMFAQVHETLDKSQGGLGIGLSLVKRLVELHGGHVSAESQGIGHGSTFTVTLPLVPADEPDAN